MAIVFKNIDLFVEKWPWRIVADSSGEALQYIAGDPYKPVIIELGEGDQYEQELEDLLDVVTAAIAALKEKK